MHCNLKETCLMTNENAINRKCNEFEVEYGVIAITEITFKLPLYMRCFFLHSVQKKMYIKQKSSDKQRWISPLKTKKISKGSPIRTDRNSPILVSLDMLYIYSLHIT